MGDKTNHPRRDPRRTTGSRRRSHRRISKSGTPIPRPGIEFWVAPDLVDANRFYLFEEWGDDELITRSIKAPRVHEFTEEIRRTLRARRSILWTSKRYPELTPYQQVVGVQSGELVIEELEHAAPEKLVP